MKVTVFTRNLEKKPFLNIFDNISDTIYSRVMRHGPKVAWGGDLKNDVTLGDLDGRSRSQPLLKVKKCLFLTISQTLFIGSKVMKVGFQVA